MIGIRYEKHDDQKIINCELVDLTTTSILDESVVWFNVNVNVNSTEELKPLLTKYFNINAEPFEYVSFRKFGHILEISGPKVKVDEQSIESAVKKQGEIRFDLYREYNDYDYYVKRVMEKNHRIYKITLGNEVFIKYNPNRKPKKTKKTSKPIRVNSVYMYRALLNTLEEHHVVPDGSSRESVTRCLLYVVRNNSDRVIRRLKKELTKILASNTMRYDCNEKHSLTIKEYFKKIRLAKPRNERDSNFQKAVRQLERKIK